MILSSETREYARAQTQRLSPWRLYEIVSSRSVTRCGLALLSSALLSGSLPPLDWGWLAWVALAPLLLACHGVTPTHAAGLGVLSGLAAAYGTMYWIFEIPAFAIHHSILLAGYLALYPALWCLGIALLSPTSTSMMFVAPALWVLLDYMRAHAGFLAFPWGTLAQTQRQNLAVLQLGSLTGEYGVTFVVALGSAALGGAFLHQAWRPAAFAALIIGAVHTGGAVALHGEDSSGAIRLAAVQPSIPVGSLRTAEGRQTTFARLVNLTESTAALRPALIAWPETAIAGNVQANPLLAADLQSLVEEMGTPLVLGVSEVEKFVSVVGAGENRPRAYNSAYFLSPGAPPSRPYHKRVLLPFGEYVPLEGFVAWPAWIGGRGYDRASGDDPQLFTLPDGTSLATLICWESLFSDLSREAVVSGARLLVQLNNPAWFGHTAAGAQQNLSSVLRAVENRTPILLASNTGPSQIIDAYGRIVAGTRHLFTADVVVGDVAPGRHRSFYTLAGDWFVYVLLTVTILAGLYPYLARSMMRVRFMTRVWFARRRAA